MSLQYACKRHTMIEVIVHPTKSILQNKLELDCQHPALLHHLHSAVPLSYVKSHILHCSTSNKDQLKIIKLLRKNQSKLSGFDYAGGSKCGEGVAGEHCCQPLRFVYTPHHHHH